MVQEIKQRLKKPTPKFFKKLRNIGLAVAAVATTIATAPIALPAVLIKIAAYLAVAGTSISVVSQATKEGE
ncbi:MAG: hypothetical protein ABIN36_17465 [Ferruginibacter sp.]